MPFPLYSFEINMNDANFQILGTTVGILNLLLQVGAFIILIVVIFKIIKRYNRARIEAAGLTGAARRKVVMNARGDIQRQLFGKHPLLHFVSQLMLTIVMAVVSLVLKYSMYNGLRMPIFYILLFAALCTTLAGFNSTILLWPLVKEKYAKGHGRDR